MARDFVKNTSNYMTLGVGSLGAIINGAVCLSFHFWANADTFDSGVNDNGLFVGFVGSNLSFLTARVDGSGATKFLRVGGRSQSADAFQARNATSSFTTGAWHACGGTLDIGADTITPYFNGAAENGGAVTFGAATFTDSSTGRTQTDSIGNSNGIPSATIQQFDGRIAEFCIWFGSRVLTAAEFVSLSAGLSPKLIAPSLGRIYFPIIGRGSSEHDYTRGLTGTINGTIGAAVHPRIILPSAQIIQFPTPAAPGGFQAAWARGANTIIQRTA